MKTVLIDNSDVSTDWIKDARLKKFKPKTKTYKEKGREIAMQDELIYGPGKGKGGGPYRIGPGGNCICPNCGLIKPHASGNPCTDELCSECGVPLVREEVLKTVQLTMARKGGK